MFTKYLPWLAGPVLLAGCAGTTPLTGSGVNSLIAIQYGTIEQVQEVQLKANYGSGVLLGGGIGALAAMHYSGATQALAAVGGAVHQEGGNRHFGHIHSALGNDDLSRAFR